MGKVITINNWWDGPILGLAYFDNIVCIYERIFDETKDDYIDEYYLSPVNDYEKTEILAEWEEWCKAVSIRDLNSFYSIHLNEHAIDRILRNSILKRKYRKKARFKGQFETGFVPIDYNAEWYD